MSEKKAKGEYKLNKRQQLFVEEFLVDENQAKAAIRAGYSPLFPDSSGHALMKKPGVRAMVEAGREAKKKRIQVKVDDVIEELKKIAFADIKDHMSWGTLKTQIGTDDDGKPIFGYKHVVDMFDSHKVDGRVVESVSISAKGTLKIKMYDKMDALDKLSKHLGVYQDKPTVACALQVVFENFPREAADALVPSGEKD